MGNKINPNSFRLGIVKPWQSRWFVRKNFRNLLEEDMVIRRTVKEKIGQAGVVAIEISRTAGMCRVMVRAARPAAPPWGPHSAQPRPTGRPAPLRATAAAEALPLPEGTLEYPRSAPGAIYADTKIRLTNATVLKLRTSVATYDEVA